MGDHTFAGVTVYDCPIDQVAALVEVLGDYFPPDASGDGTSLPGGDSIDLGEQLSDYQAREGVVTGHIVPRLMEAAPGATWEATQQDEPWHQYAPDLGLHIGYGEDGDHYSRADIMAAAERAAQDGRSVIAALDKLTGGPWRGRFQMMRAQAEKRTVTLFAHPMCGTCEADRVREQVRDADGLRVWVHVETGEQACDNVVTLHLRDTEHPYHLMPATLTAERADDWAEGDVIVVLPNGQRFTVSEDEAVPANLATPEQDGDQ